MNNMLHFPLWQSYFFVMHAIVKDRDKSESLNEKNMLLWILSVGPQDEEYLKTTKTL